MAHSGNKAKAAARDFINRDLSDTELKTRLREIERKNEEANWYNISIAVMAYCNRGNETTEREFEAKKNTIELFSEYDMERAFADKTVEKALEN